MFLRDGVLLTTICVFLFGSICIQISHQIPLGLQFSFGMLLFFPKIGCIDHTHKDKNRSLNNYMIFFKKRTTKKPPQKSKRKKDKDKYIINISIYIYYKTNPSFYYFWKRSNFITPGHLL